MSSHSSTNGGALGGGSDLPARVRFDPPERSARDWIGLAFRRRNIFFGFFLAVVGSVTFLTYWLPPTYEVDATILVREARADVPLAAKDSGELILLSEITEELLNSEIEILRSRELLEDVVHMLFGEPSAARAEDAALDKTVLRLEEDFEVARIRKSNLIRVSFRSQDPEEAQRVVAALTERYLELRTRIYLMPEAVAFFEGEMSDAGRRLASAEDVLEEYLEQAGVTMIDMNQGVDGLASEKRQLLHSMSELETGIANARVAIRAGEERITALREQISREPERLPTVSRASLDGRFEHIEQTIVSLELRRDALLQDYTAENRHVRDVETQIALAKKRLEEVESEVGELNRSEANPIHRGLRAELLQAEAEQKAARARLASLERQMAVFIRESAELNKKTFEVDRLRREARAAEEAYLLYSKKHEEARISEAMDRRNLVDVSIAQPAKRPLEPVEPNKKRNLLLGVILGTVGGLGLAAGAGALDHTFVTGHDVERRLAIPLLASIPEGK